MQNPSQEPPASSKALNKDLKNQCVLCNFKIKKDSQNFGHICIKRHWPYPIQNNYINLQSGAFNILQSPNSGLKGPWYCLQLQSKDGEPQFGSWVYQRPLTTSKSGSRCQTSVRNLQQPPNLQIHPPNPQNQDLKNLYFCAFKIKRESQTYRT